MAGDVVSTSVEIVTNRVPSTAVVHLEFTRDKAAEFLKFTQSHLKQKVQILVGTNVVATPIIQSEIPSRKIYLDFPTRDEATRISNYLMTKLPDAIIPAGSINIIGMKVSQLMPLYADLADAQLDTSQLGELPPINIRFKNTNDVTRSEALQLLDKVLYDQAGIVVTHPDTKHVLFRYRSSGNEK